jgi:hypothetical protein
VAYVEKLKAMEMNENFRNNSFWGNQKIFLKDVEQYKVESAVRGGKKE